MSERSIYFSIPINEKDENESLKQAQLDLSDFFKCNYPTHTYSSTLKEIYIGDNFLLDHSDIMLVNLNYEEDYAPIQKIFLEIGRAYSKNIPIFIVSDEKWVYNNGIIQFYATKIFNYFSDATDYLRSYYI